jgi:hypothetical protein
VGSEARVACNGGDGGERVRADRRIRQGRMQRVTGESPQEIARLHPRASTRAGDRKTARAVCTSGTESVGNPLAMGRLVALLVVAGRDDGAEEGRRAEGRQGGGQEVLAHRQGSPTGNAPDHCLTTETA